MRAIAAVIVGYVAIFIAVMVCLTLAYMLLGESFAYEQGTLQVTTGWSLVSLGAGAVAAVIAGLACGAVARTRTPVTVFAAIILVLGLGMAVAHLFTDDPDAVPEIPVQEMSAFERSSESIAPPWYHFGNAFVGAAGALLGGRLVRRA